MNKYWLQAEIQCEVDSIDKHGAERKVEDMLKAIGEKSSIKITDYELKAIQVITEQLAPCPFFGGEAQILMGYTHFQVECKDRQCMGCAITKSFPVANDAVKAWNRRANT